ncbi:MAG: sensor histidine kinase, partial [Arenimonas sp.]
RLSAFIAANMEPLLAEWEDFARSTIPATDTMTTLAIRDHAREILLTIVADMESVQTEAQRHEKSEGRAPDSGVTTSADKHGSLRQLVGFDLNQLAAEFRALRATVLRLWAAKSSTCGTEELEEITRFNEGIDQALAESISSYSEHVSTSRDTFLAILGHDLRTPLGALAGSLENVGRAELTPEQRARALQVGKRSVASISQMITDLLEYTRSRLGRGIQVVPQSSDLGTLCNDALDEMRAAYPTQIFESTASGDLVIAIDAPRMRQVLVNLLVNAVQHGEPGRAVVLDARGEAGRVCIEVRNYGKPIPAEALQVIFNPLVQLGESTSDPDQRTSTSLGLGLYIAREIVTGHGGTVAATSSAKDGTAFIVEIPRG